MGNKLFRIWPRVRHAKIGQLFLGDERFPVPGNVNGAVNKFMGMVERLNNINVLFL
jgi:hypothetical protein